VLATGLVVDDAIVVLENIVRRRAMGARARAAAVVGTREVFFAVLATTATLAAVFVPISFLPGVAGGLFREFGFVLAISVLISSVTALTFAPMLAATILGDAGRARRRSILGRIVGGAGNLLAAVYEKLLRAALAAPLVVIVASSAFAFAAWIAFLQLPQELTPKEDRGSVALSVTAPQGVSIDYMGRQMDRINAVLKPYLDSGEGAAVFTIAGRNGANSGFAILTLAPWEERARSQTDIAAEIGRKVAGIPGVRAFTLSSNSLGIRGGGQGLRIALLGPDYASLATEGDKLVAALEATPELANVRLDFQATQPQLSVVIDRDRAQDLGGVFVRTRDGRMVPMSSIATIREEATAPSLSRESQQRAVPITADLDNGTALRAGLDAARTVAAATLPPGFRIVPLGEAATLEETSGGFATTFGFALVVILLVLAAQFESFVAALIIIATVPFGLAAAVFAIALTGGTLNLYSQIGLVMLVGIMAKNGILIVEFANHLRDEGRGVRAAILEASLTRLRPVSMTMIATVVGAVPLVLAFGAGAEARVALGWVLVGGLGFATIFTLFLTPVAYLLLAGFSKPRAEGEARLARELEEAEEARLAGDDEPAAPTGSAPEPTVPPAPPAPSPAE